MTFLRYCWGWGRGRKRRGGIAGGGRNQEFETGSMLFYGITSLLPMLVKRWPEKLDQKDKVFCSMWLYTTATIGSDPEEKYTHM